jgi:23S rRNA (guanosine2251-2'-O)-methyltransferase
MSPAGKPGPAGGRAAGRGGRTKSGKPRAGTGGYGKRRLEGKGPTPPAHLRPGHPAQRRAAAAGRGEAAPGDGAGRGRGNAGPARARSTGPARAGSSGAASGGAGRARSARTGAGAVAAASGAGRGQGRGAASRSAAAKGASPRAAGGQAGGRARGAGDAPEVVAGRNAVLEALTARVPATALFAAQRLDADDRVRDVIALAAQARIPMIEAGRPELDRLTGGAIHQGLALRIAPYAYAHPADLTARAAAQGQPALIVALDGVTDPRNLGAITRSAAAFGAHGVLIPARRSARVTAGAWKASAGALTRVPVAQAPNLVRALASYAEEGLFVVGLDAAGGTSVDDLEVADGPLVLVVGSEGRGLSRLVTQRCDLLARIPMAAATESLNAAVAAGIALHAVAVRRPERP